jgi:hypothetical protein
MHMVMRQADPMLQPDLPKSVWQHGHCQCTATAVVFAGKWIKNIAGLEGDCRHAQVCGSNGEPHSASYWMLRIRRSRAALDPSSNC